MERLRTVCLLKFIDCFNCRNNSVPFEQATYAYFFPGRCWPQVHDECVPLLLRCSVMSFKKSMYEANVGPFENCIPAIGEGSRHAWPDAAASSSRQLCISLLKRKHSSWKKDSSMLKSAWADFQEESDIWRRNDLYAIKASIPDLCLYSIDEVKWMNKSYRALEKKIRQKK